MNDEERRARDAAAARRYRERHPEWKARRNELRRTGRPKGRPPIPFAERAWQKIDKTPGCWLWIGARDRDGYGQTSVGQRPMKAHRAMYELLVGPIPGGLQIDHLCRTPACVNPAHMEPVSADVNFARGSGPVVGGRRNAAKIACPRGHPYDEANTRLDTAGRRHCRTCIWAWSQITR